MAMKMEAAEVAWQVEQRPEDLMFRRRTNGRSVVVYYREDCDWYVFCPPGQPVGFEAKGNTACLIEALRAAEAAAWSLPPVPEPVQQPEVQP